MQSTRKPDGRSKTQIRPLIFTPNFTRYAEGSVLIQSGHTQVLCTASIEDDIPKWLKGKGQGWVTAEYAMLPRSTHTRSKRDREKVSGRTQEIQRLIGRAARSMVDLKKLGELQITLDCDVLQADGGTRTASITGCCIALGLALKSKGLDVTAFQDTVAAVSVGLHNGEVLVDLDYEEDSSCEVDMNFVMTGRGAFVEIQGTAERGSFTQEQMNFMTQGALTAINDIHKKQVETLKNLGVFLPK